MNYISLLKIYLIFFSQINVIQNLIIDLYDSNPRGENGGYKTGFLEELKKTLIKENVVLDVDYFLEFFMVKV